LRDARAGQPGDRDYYDTTTDLKIPGAGVPLQFTRTYDAEVAQAESGAGSTPPLLGYGWSYNLGMSLAYDATSGLATVTEANGAQITFQNYAQNASEPPWCPSDANGAVFCPTAPRYIASLSESEGGTFTYVNERSSPTTYTFNSSGALTDIADANGDTLSVSSYGSCPSGDSCTEWTSSSSGQSLVVEASQATESQPAELLSVFDPSATTQAVSFSYSGTGCSTWSSGQPADLCSATDPGEPPTAYTYDTSQSSEEYQYDEVTMSPPGTGAVATTYTQGQVTQQTVTTAAGVTQTTTFSYASDADLAGGIATTVTTYPDGTTEGDPTETSEYLFSNEVLVEKVVGYGSSNAATTYYAPDPATLVPVETEDGNGNVSSAILADYATGGTASSSADPTTVTDAVGNTQQYAYTAANEIWCHVDAADYLSGVRCLQTEPQSPPTAGSGPADDAYCPNQENTSCLGATVTYYNSADEPVAVTNPLGYTSVTAYTPSGGSEPDGLPYCQVDDAAYTTTQFASGGVTCPSYSNTPPGATGATVTTYDTSGDTMSVTDPDGDKTSYSYGVAGHPGLVSSETDPDGTTTSFTYNTAGQVTQKQATFGSYSAPTFYGYDADGRLFCEIDPLPYALSNDTLSCPSAADAPTTAPSTSGTWTGLSTGGEDITVYDSDGRPIYQVNAIGGVTETAYDEAGEVYCTVSPFDYAKADYCESANTWSDSGTVTCATIAGGSAPPTDAGATISYYDSNGRPCAVINPLGGITLTTYDEANNVLSTTVQPGNTNAPNIVTSYTYDADERVVKTTVGSGSAAATTLQFYDPNGNVYCSVSANEYAKGSAAYQCPAWQANWIETSKLPSPTALYSSSPSASQANNVTTTFYDADGDEVQSSNADLNTPSGSETAIPETTIYAYDGDGRVFCTSDPTNFGTWLAANPSGTYPYICPTTPPTSPPTTTTGYTTTIYDSAGRTLSSTDQLGDTTSYTYAPGGQVLTVTNPSTKVTTNCYYYENGSGQCAHAAPTGGGSGDDLYQTTTPATSADPSGETTSYTYYAGDASDTTTTPAGTTTDAYDALGDLASQTYSGAASGYAVPATVSFTYNADGSRYKMTDGTGTTTYGYDSAGDLTSQDFSPTAASGLASEDYSYGYYDNGALESVTYPSFTQNGHTYNNATATYTYDARGNEASVTDWLGNRVAFTTDGDGNLTSQENAVSTSNPNGTSSTSFAYDDADQQTGASSNTSCSGSSGTITQSFAGGSGSRNADGQLAQYEDSYTGGCAGPATYERNYSYDQAGRVTYEGATAGGSANFAYDAASDPTEISSFDQSGNPDTYTQDFDAAGEVTSQTPQSGSQGVSSTYTYDTLGDLTKTTSSLDTSYGYDELGHMTGLIAAEDATGYQYDGDGLEVATGSPKLGWGSAKAINSTSGLFAVSCATVYFCATVGGDDVATYDIQTGWSSTSTISGAGGLSGISCPKSNFCAAVDSTGHIALYNGSWGTATNIDGANSFYGVSCPTTTFCAAVDSAGQVVTYIYSGSSWTTVKHHIDGSNYLSAISCPTTSFCAAVDEAGNVFTYNGTSWSSADLVDSGWSFDAVSCPTASFCLAVDDNGSAATYNGSTWSLRTNIEQNGDGVALMADSCLSATSCTVLDAGGDALTYNGYGWSPATNIDGRNAFSGVSCPASMLCVGVDESGNGLVYGNSSWSSPVDKDGSNALYGVSCATSTFCAAVDGVGNIWDYNGSWTEVTGKDGSNALTAVSCPTSSFCEAVDENGNAVKYTGSWQAATTVDSSVSLYGVSCTSSSFCVAVGEEEDYFTYNGSWHGPYKAVSGLSNLIEALSCVTTTFCVAGDSGGNVLVYNGSSWTKTNLESSGLIRSASCTTTSFCVVGDTNGNVFAYNGTSWTQHSIDGSNEIESVSCPLTTFCMAADASGRALVFDGSTWASPKDVDSNRSLNLSCVSPSFCALADESGYVFTYTASTSQITWGETGSIPEVLSDGTNYYIDGPSGEPVEQVNTTSTPPSSNPVFLTFTPADSSWLVTSTTGAELAFYGYDAFGNLAFGAPLSPFGYAGQYADDSSSVSSGFYDMRARWYQSETGEFTTRDPDFDQTDQAYAYAGDDPVNETDPTGQCWPSWACGVEHEVGAAWTSTVNAFNCLNSACYTTKQGFANAVAGAESTINWWSGGPPVAAPYPCSDTGAYDLGAQLPYAAAFAIPGLGDLGVGGWAAVESNSADWLPVGDDEPTVTVPSGAGADTRWVTVGRWMSPDELQAMSTDNSVQYGAGDTSYVAYPASAGAYSGAAPGSVYVEYEVPASALYPAGQADFAQIPSPESATGLRYTKLGRPPTAEVPVKNIVVVSSK
jgi:RHS repeat-associated protein